MRIALATLPFAGTISGALENLQAALAEAAQRGAAILCTPENYLPGLRGVGFDVEPPDPAALRHGVDSACALARRFGVAMILGTERRAPEGLLATALVIDAGGEIIGRQDKVQIDPDEEGIYSPSSGRSVFEAAGLRFGVSICHEGWRYPETVRWAARRGAQVVFHPHLSLPGPMGKTPLRWADPENTFHEKAALCRAAENTIFFATVNYAIAGAATASAVIRPDGVLQAHQPHGVAGVLVADLDLSAATGLLARRYRPVEHAG